MMTAGGLSVISQCNFSLVRIFKSYGQVGVTQIHCWNKSWRRGQKVMLSEQIASFLYKEVLMKTTKGY